MLLPSVVVEIKDFCRAGIYRSSAIPARMAPVLVVISLIIAEFVLQVGHGPE
jgi:hypothetical protein